MVEITTVTAIAAMVFSLIAAFRQSGKDSAARAREMGEITVTLRDISRNLDEIKKDLITYRKDIEELKERVNRLENRLEAKVDLS